MKIKWTGKNVQPPSGRREDGEKYGFSVAWVFILTTGYISWPNAISIQCHSRLWLLINRHIFWFINLKFHWNGQKNTTIKCTSTCFLAMKFVFDSSHSHNEYIQLIENAKHSSVFWKTWHYFYFSYHFSVSIEAFSRTINGDH